MKVLLTQKMAGIAGSEQYLLTLIPQLLSRGLEVHFLVVQHPNDSAKNAGFIASLEQSGAVVHKLNSRLPFGIGILIPMKNLIKTQDYDIVHTNLIHSDVWGAVIKVLWCPNLVLISAKHGYQEEYQTKFGFDPDHVKPNAFAIATWLAARKANAMIVISRGLRHLLTESRLVDASKCHLIPYGVSTSMRSSGPKEQRYGDPQLLILGRLVAVKQHRLVIEILSKLLLQFPRLKLVIVGAGPLEEELKIMARDNGVDHAIIWAGFQSAIHDYIRSSDALILPSSAEGFGMVILEAWMNSKPVIAFDVPAPNEIIDNDENGVLVRPFDTEELAIKILALLHSPTTMRNMGRRGFEKFNSEYTIDQMVSRTIALYQSLSDRAKTEEGLSGLPDQIRTLDCARSKDSSLTDHRLSE